jgi:hypothetical protein
MPLLIEQQRNLLKKLGLEEYVISNDRYNYKFNGRVKGIQFYWKWVCVGQGVAWEWIYN